jgi:hypothetical protein
MFRNCQGKDQHQFEKNQSFSLPHCEDRVEPVEDPRHLRPSVGFGGNEKSAARHQEQESQEEIKTKIDSHPPRVALSPQMGQINLVGASRFELPTSCSQGRRANPAALRPENNYSYHSLNGEARLRGLQNPPLSFARHGNNTKTRDYGFTAQRV